MSEEIAHLRNDIRELTKSSSQVVTQVAVLTQRFDDMDKHTPPCEQLEKHVEKCHTNSTSEKIKQAAIKVAVNAIIIALLGALWIGISQKIIEANETQKVAANKEK